MFDGRNLFDRAEMEKLGWIYKSVGTVKKLSRVE